MRWSELAELQACDLDFKIRTAHDAIVRAFEASHRPAIAFSGGKDSTALLHLIRSHFPERARSMVVIYGNTGVEFPECVKFARQLALDWQLDFHEARPGKTERPGYKYAGQRRIYDRLARKDGLPLKLDGKLVSTEALERACPDDLRMELEAERCVWPAGTMKSYWWCADQYGWPLLGKSWSRLDARRINIDTFLAHSQSVSSDPSLLAYYDMLRQVKISQYCCQVLKKDPAQRVQAELGVDLIFKGLMASESRSRTKNFLLRGYLFRGADKAYLAGAPFWHCQPMALWTDDDVWAYIRQNRVPYAPLYDLTYRDHTGKRQHVRRNGCLGCGTDFGYRDNHLTVLRQTHKHAWTVIMRAGMAEQIRRLQVVMRKYQQTIFDCWTTEELVSAQPCALDDLDGMGAWREGADEYDAEIT